MATSGFASSSQTFPPGREETQESLVTLLRVNLEFTSQWERDRLESLAGGHLRELGPVDKRNVPLALGPEWFSWLWWVGGRGAG